MSSIDVQIKMPDMDLYLRKANGGNRSLTPREVGVLRAMANDMLRVIKMNWPIDTGTSNAAWNFTINPVAGGIAINFRNRMWYASWVTDKGDRPVSEGGRPLYQQLLQAVWAAAKQKTFRLLRNAIDATEAELTDKSQPSLIRLMQQQAGR